VFDPVKQYRQIACGLYIRGSWQSNPQCHVYDMSSNGYNVLQVSNFGVLNSGDSVLLLLPNIKFCLDVGKKCGLDFNTAYTVSLDNPYYLNKQTVQLTQSVSSSSAYQSINVASDSSLTFKISASTPSLCTSSVWSFGFSPSNPAQINDYLIITVPSQYVYLNIGSIYSDNGTVGIVLDNEHQLLIVVVHLTTTVPGFQLITLQGMVHPYEEGTVITPQLNFWHGKLKSGLYQMPSLTFSGNGILYTWLGLLPDTSNNLAKAFTDTDLGSEAVIKFGFTLCKPVASTGAIIIDVKDGIAYNDTCTVYSFGNQMSFTSLDTNIRCTFSNGAYTITGFSTTTPMLSATAVIRLRVNATFNLDDIKLYSYNVSSPLGSLVGSNLAALGGNSYPFGQTGYTYPSLLSFDPFIQKTTTAVMNQRG